MWGKRWLPALFTVLLALSIPGAAFADETQGRPHCLIVYQSPELKDQAVMIANLIGHFEISEEIVSEAELETGLTANADTIVAIVQRPDAELKKKLQILGGTGHTVLWIGAVDSGDKIAATDIIYKGETITELNTTVFPIRQREGFHTAAAVSDGMNKYPLAVQGDNEWIYASLQLSGTPGLVFADLLHDVFRQEHPEAFHAAYIRIEDVSPLTDPQKLREIADYLYSRNVPFIVAVIPVYSDSTGTQIVNFEDKPAFTEALRYMVAHGGSLVMHGYKHKYRNSETGEGFEFWDAANDKPIPNEEAYTAGKLEKGIARMVKQGLYPLAFEPPHYAMSQNGYRIISRYFSTLIGNLQLNDSTYLVSQEVPYRLQQTVYGLQIIPETVGYVLDEPGSVVPMLQKAKQLMMVRDSVIGAFFHPYLNIDELKELVSGLSRMNVDFIDLKTEPHEVKTDFVSIRSGDGSVHAEILNQDKLDRLSAVPDKKFVWAQKAVWAMTWGIAGVVILFLILFVLFLVFMKNRRKNRLFYEEVHT